MMTEQLVDTFKEKGVRLWREDGGIRYRAPKGAMTEQLLAQLRENKAALLEILPEGPDDPAGETGTLTPDPARRYEPFALTDVQQAYWIGRGDAFELGNVSSHIYFEIENPSLDIERLNRAWQRVVARHDMLRAVILPDGRQQVLADPPPYVFKVRDLRGKPSGDVDAALAEAREEMSHQVLPAGTWPLFDIRVSRYGDGISRVHVGLDYLFADAASHLLIFNEWCALYEDPETNLPDLEISFRDYVAATAARRRGAARERAEAYWFERVPDLPLAPPLPVKTDAAGAGKTRFNRRAATLDAGAWERLKQRAARGGLTPSGVLQAAYAQVLAAWSNTRRFTINLTLFNREPLHPEVPLLVGEFTSLILLEVDHTHAESFLRKAKRLHQRLMDDMDHGSVSAVRVIRELARHRGRSEEINMPVVFTSTIGYAADGYDDLEVFKLGEVVYSITQTPQVWIDFQVMEHEGGLAFNWDSVDALFPEKVLDDMFTAFTGYLRLLADNEAAWHETGRAFIPEYQAEARQAVNETAGPVPTGTLHGLFDTRAAEQADAVAVAAPGLTLTYADLSRRADGVAHAIGEAGVKPGALVAVAMEKGWEEVAAVLGVLKAGCAYLPIDPQVPQRRLDYLLDHGEARLILRQSCLADRFQWPEQPPAVDVDRLDFSGPLQAPAGGDAGDLAYVIYTSGSTGTPKGVMIDHRGAVNTLLDINRRFDVGPGDAVLSISALNFDLSVYDIFGILAAGGTIVIPEAEKRIDPSHWAELFGKHRITVWNTVPTLMQMFMEYLGTGPEQDGGTPGHDALRLVLLSGDFIPPALPDTVRSLFKKAEVISLGGATEASVWSILYPIDTVDPGWKRIPYGRPMTNQRFNVLDPAGHDCPDWVPGELCIAGTGLALGYWRDPEKTGAAFIPHPRTGERLYRTGDIGRFMPDGCIDFLGRRDSQVKIRGYRIELGEIEATLKQSSGVAEAVVVTFESRQGNKQLAAYVVAAEADARPDEDTLRTALQSALPDYMVPATYVFLDRLPLNPNGKVDRGRLPAPDRDPDTLAGTYVAPRDRLEKTLASLWEDALECPRIGVYDNFFFLGGDSLIATRLVLKIKDALKVRVSLPKLFDTPTVAGLAERIRNSEALPRELALEELTGEDLLSEAVLDPGIQTEGLPRVSPGACDNVLLTGATGFLGAFLLKSLIERTNAAIHCLVRADDKGAAMARLRKNMEKYELWDDAAEERILPVVGDLTRPGMGLSGAEYDYLAEHMDLIYHNAALVHFLYSYDRVKPHNVTGTHEILRLACARKVTPVHYVSTISVFSDHGLSGTRIIRETEGIDDSGELDTGYAQSKWVAEKLVEIAKSRGLPVAVYRPGMVAGDSRRGVGDLDDFIFRVFKGSLQIGCVPDLEAKINALPVDVISNAVIRFSLRGESLGRVFHLVHPEPVAMDRLVQWMRDRGYAIETVSWEVWRRRLGEASEENAIYPLLPMFPDTLDEAADHGEIVFDMTQSMEMFDKLGYGVPPIDEALLNTYHGYLTRVGYIPHGGSEK